MLVRFLIRLFWFVFEIANIVLKIVLFIAMLVRHYLFLGIVLFLGFWHLGCAAIFPFTTIPGPRPGMVIVSNENPNLWAEVLVFRGSFSLDGLVAIDQFGQPTLVRTPILFWVTKEGHLTAEELVSEDQRALPRWLSKFKITAAQSPIEQGARCTPVGQVIFFSPRPAEYTLLVHWRNFYGRLVPIGGRTEEVIRFRTRGYPFEYDNRYRNLDGTPIGADRIILLSSY